MHGYTREILERDGEAPVAVYREFAEYVGKLPLVSYNLEYDLEEVLQPEWKRLRIAPIGRPGFCALRLAQRLLDPVPAGNCKLQTLRQFYRLPEHGAHTGMGDVETVVDLMTQVLRPIAEHRGLDTWEQIVAYSAEEWYPSRIAFGKHKGRLVGEARRDAELRRWLDWLEGSTNARSARMGRWYLAQLGLESVLNSSTKSRADIPVTAEEEGELKRLWRKLVLLYHPDRFAHEPDKLETYEKLVSAINLAKDNGDIAVLRESPDYELCRISEQKSGVLDELAAQRIAALEKEIADLEAETDRLAREIEELGGEISRSE